MSGFDNTNRGVLFKNKDQRNDKDPLYRGSINIDGKEFWLDAWLNTAKKSGEKFMSLRVKPKTAGAQSDSPSKPANQDFDDDIPF